MSELDNPEVSDRLAKQLLKESPEREGARYKIDLLLASDFSLQKPSAGIISLWESGRALHGDGDTKLYVCPGRHLGINECEAIIPGLAQGHDSSVCANCGRLWKASELIGEIGYRLPPPKWADVFLRWMHRLNMEADLRIIYPPDDIRSLAAREQERQRGGELMEPARARRATRVYPLKNLIKDTSAGAGIHDRILAFVCA
jgi:hypothetical protein